MPVIHIDGKPYEVKGDQNLLHTILSLGINLPYFCWHPAMGSVGACRQCAVIQYRDEKDARGRIIMACMTPVTDSMRVSVESVDAREFRAKVIEWLMVNHPHDCPVCDEGGECHLQDMTVMTGHIYRHFRFKKRTHRNQDLGPFITHEMNRCIACFRCVRFYRDFAGGRDFNVFAAHDHVYFGRYESGVPESEFSGNLIEICLTGVFDDKTLMRHYTRKWDMQMAPSICVHCGLGCNAIAGERYGMLRRIRNRYNGEVNGYFLCDRGRFGYEFANSKKRIQAPLIRNGKQGPVQKATKEDALKRIADIIDKGRLIGIGSPRASLESNSVLKSLVGPERFCSGMSAKENGLVSQILDIMKNSPARCASQRDVTQADAVLILGEDLTNTAPMLALAVRQAVRNQPKTKADRLRMPQWDDYAVRELLQDEKGPLYIATPYETKLDDIATATWFAAPDDIARLGFAVAAQIDSRAPSVSGLPEDIRSLASRIAEALKHAQHPVVISGASCHSEAIVRAAANVAWALCASGKSTAICFTLPECNSLGIELLGGHDLLWAFEAIRNHEAETVIIVENDLYRRMESSAVDEFLSACGNLIVLDCLENATTIKADIALPAGTFAESDGTLISSEGRAQRFYQALNPDPIIQSSWKWITDIAQKVNRSPAGGWSNLDDISNAAAASIPAFSGKAPVAPEAGFRIHDRRIPRQQQRYSGRTAMHANINVHEPQPREDTDSALSFSMEGFEGEPPPALTPFFWSPGWSSVQAVNKYQDDVGGPLRGGDPGVRLIEPDSNARPSFFSDIPAGFKSRTDEWYLVPIYHIYGSEELSLEAEGLSQLVPKSYVALNQSGAGKLGGEPGRELRVTLGEREFHLPLMIRKGLPDGVAGVPAGLPGLHGIVLPAWGRIG